MANQKPTPKSAPSAASPPKGKPLLFGDPTPDAERIERAKFLRNQWDRSYVPVYSERVVENEIRVRDGLDPLPTPKLCWIPVSNLDGTNVDGRRTAPYAMAGFQLATKAVLDHYGYGMPPAAHLAPDGTIRREDAALAFVNEEVADFNRRQRREDLDKARGQGTEPAEGVAVVEHTKGRAPLPDVYEKLTT